MHNDDQKARGFSLPELIVVIAIIIILAAILVIALMHFRDDALVAACETNETRIAEALDSYAVDHDGQYPTASGPVNAALFGGPSNPYMANVALLDPADGRPYQYTLGQGTCPNSDADYQIVDTGGHTSVSLIALLQGEAQADSIAFCADSGLYAFQSGSGQSAGFMMQPQQP
jgi:prepilin-type N-terminal cleavage/methylation domain-containing protein